MHDIIAILEAATAERARQRRNHDTALAAYRALPPAGRPLSAAKVKRAAQLQKEYTAACARVRLALDAYPLAVGKHHQTRLRRAVICAHMRAERARRDLQDLLS